MRKSTILFIVGACLLLLNGTNSAQASLSLLDDKLTLSGFLKNMTAYNPNHDRDFQEIENTIQLESEYKFNDNLSFFTIFRYYYDTAFDVNPLFEDVRKQLHRTRGTDWLRECYLNYESPSLDVRIGKQQVVWGTADGIKIMDVVCPTDQRRYYLDDYVDSRIARWMLKLEYSPKVNGTLQFLFIPDFATDYYAPAGSPFTYYAFTLLQRDLIDPLHQLASQGHYTFDEKHHYPGQNFKNSSFGVRWLDILPNGLEYTLNYLHGYGTFAGNVHITNHGGPLGQPVPGYPYPQGDYVLNYKYPQTELFGFTFTKGINTGPLTGTTVRGEFAYIHNNYNKTDGMWTKSKLFPPIPIPLIFDAIQYGITKVDNYKYVLGIDKYIVTNWLASFQFIQLVTNKTSENGNNLLFGPTNARLNKFYTFFTTRISTDFMHERIKPDCLFMYGTQNEWRISPRIEYELRDYLNIAVGGHMFWGRRTTLLGEFRENDEVYCEIKYGF
jgi:hypothetical protein